jgi:26S proteasome regulatory subunit T1
MVQKINKLTGIRELDTGISLPTQWNLAEDSKKATEQPLQVARCNKIINDGG